MDLQVMQQATVNRENIPRYLISNNLNMLLTFYFFQDHMLVHAGTKPHKCELCPESFVKKEYLARHMRFHGVNVERYPCHLCSKDLSTPAYLQDHIRRLHSNIAKCLVCKSEILRENMNEHLQSVHGSLPCSMCSKVFYVPKFLKRHELKHTMREKDSFIRQQCDFCYKKLGPKNVKAHVFRKHPEEFEEWQESFLP